MQLVKVKVSINSPREGLLRQTLNGDGVWAGFKFFINEDVRECDYWIIYSKGTHKFNSTKVPKGNVFLLTGEPESVYHYSPLFIQKFSKIITSRRDIRHKEIDYSHPAQPWWIGKRIDSNGSISYTMTFRDLAKPLTKKPKLISVISSTKSFTAGHQSRIEFVMKLKQHFGDNVDLFGNGLKRFDDKVDVLRDYRYHIVIENSSYEDYWTEKLADCFLAECFPFYYGCTNLERYFDQSSYETIDINDIDSTINKIEKAIDKNLYDERLESIREAKQRVLYRYNFFPSLIGYMTNAEEAKSMMKIKHESQYFDLYKVVLIAKRVFYIIKSKL